MKTLKEIQTKREELIEENRRMINQMVLSNKYELLQKVAEQAAKIDALFWVTGTIEEI